MLKKKAQPEVLTSKIISEDIVVGWSMSRVSGVADPDIIMQANLLTGSGYFRPWALLSKYKANDNMWFTNISEINTPRSMFH